MIGGYAGGSPSEHEEVLPYVPRLSPFSLPYCPPPAAAAENRRCRRLPGPECRPVSGTAAPIAPMAVNAAAARTVSGANGRDDEGGGTVLPRLTETKTIGSTVDPLNSDQNPYGLDIARADAGLLHRGDLVVCNFNDAANVQGNGTSIVALRPHPGATPTRIAREPTFLGCTALTLGPTNAICWLHSSPTTTRSSRPPATP